MSACGRQPSSQLHKFAKLVVVALLTLSLGVHWALLQSVAWVGMVVSYSHTAPFSIALAQTFDGKHPCQICKLVQNAKADEKRHETSRPTTKLERVLPVGLSVTLFPPEFEQLTTMDSFCPQSRCEPPPSPPPKRA